jgi:hypothetical protein
MSVPGRKEPGSQNILAKDIRGIQSIKQGKSFAQSFSQKEYSSSHHFQLIFIATCTYLNMKINITIQVMSKIAAPCFF